MKLQKLSYKCEYCNIYWLFNVNIHSWLPVVMYDAVASYINFIACVIVEQ